MLATNETKEKVDISVEKWFYDAPIPFNAIYSINF